MQVMEIQPRDHNDLQDVHSDIKIDQIFKKVSKNTMCFHIWKVEQDRIEAVPKTQYGIFKDDCTYIVYGACNGQMHINQDTITRDVKTSTGLVRFIHFWLGKNTSPQKSGNVAFKIMELDTYLGHIATLYRETQGNESSRFLSYFKKGINILSSVAEKNNSVCQLFQIAGRQLPMCTEMDSINWEHFSCEYAMILKTPNYLFAWLGRSSSPTEKRNALNIGTKMREEFDIENFIIVDDGYEQSMNKNAKDEWNNYLPLKNRLVNQIASVEKPPQPPLKLYKCGYHTGKYRIEEVKSTAPEQCDLSDSDCAYIIDGCTLGVWMWLGRLVSPQEKVEAMRNARGFVKKKKYPYSTPVVRVIEDHEPLEFQHLFSSWTSANETSPKIAKLLGKLDSLTLLQRPKMAAESQLIDDGTGEKHIYQLIDDQYVEVNSDKYIPFYSTECYILKYIITLSESNHIQSNRSKCNTVLYYWSGKNALPEMKTRSEKLAEKFFKTLGNNAIMIKMHENSETPHFLQIFNGKFIIFQQRPNCQKNQIKPCLPINFVLKVIGDCTYNSKAIQVNALEAMSSRECFIIKTTINAWVWCGQSSTGDAREAAKNIGNHLLSDFTLVLESKEPDDFWATTAQEFDQLLEIQNDFDNTLQNTESSTTFATTEMFSSNQISLYLSYKRQGVYFRREIISFDQSDLAPENIYLLDAGNILFIWIGEMKCQEEYQSCWLMAKLFLKTYPAKRNENAAIALVKQGCEPNIFVGLFETWDDKFWDNYIPYEKMQELTESSFHSNKFISIEANDFDKHQKYPLTVLQQEAELLPPGVDITRKEVHLTHDDFVELFKMKYLEFDGLPNWKKQELKKKYKLF